MFKVWNFELSNYKITNITKSDCLNFKIVIEIIIIEE